jgi:hypothetical protein
MASIQPRRRGKHTYYVIVESRRINGKPRPVVVKYLGSAATVALRLEQAQKAQTPVRADVLDFGAVAALWDLASRLDLVATIDRQVPKRDQGISVGRYLTLAAVNRCVATTSKARFADWYRRTVLTRLCPVARRCHVEPDPAAELRKPAWGEGRGFDGGRGPGSRIALRS